MLNLLVENPNRNIWAISFRLELEGVKLLKHVQYKVTKRISLVDAFDLFECSSSSFQNNLFYSQVPLLLTWLYSI